MHRNGLGFEWNGVYRPLRPRLWEGLFLLESPVVSLLIVEILSGDGK